jgi:hypothetical protein
MSKIPLILAIKVHHKQLLMSNKSQGFRIPQTFLTRIRNNKSILIYYFPIDQNLKTKKND